MLTQVTFKNFKSFGKKTVISFKPSKIEYLESTNVENGILKGVAFYGDNASGKTNALLSITLLLDLLFKQNIPFDDLFTRLNKERRASFEYTFSEDGHTITYSFALDRQTRSIANESLIVNHDAVLTRIGSEAESDLTENNHFENLAPNVLFLRSVYFNTQFAGYPILRKWMTWLQNSVYMNPMRAFSGIIPFQNPDKSPVNLHFFLERFGVGPINDFLEKNGFPFTIAYDDEKSPFAGVIPFVNRVRIIRDGLASIEYRSESMGIQYLLGILPAFLTVIENGSILAIDEFSSGLHPDLEELLVCYFYKHAKNAQLIFVSHSTNLLKTSVLRPDQVYAVEFDKEGSKLARFSDYGMRESQNMEKMYLAGVFGGLPHYHEGKA